MTSKKVNDLDPQETQEWIEAIEAVIERDGHERAQYLLRHSLNYSLERSCDGHAS